MQKTAAGMPAGTGHFDGHKMPSVSGRLVAQVWSYPTFPPSVQSELFDTDSEGDRSQSQHMLGPQAPPQRPCGIRAYKTPARPRWDLFHLRLASSPVAAGLQAL
jgi:hypothetical protein